LYQSPSRFVQFEVAKDPRPKNAPLFSEEELERQLPTIQLGIQQYNAGYFFESHETLEDVWYRSPMSARTFLQAIIQLAAAFVHLMRHEYPGTVRLLRHSLDKLEDAPDAILGVDASSLREDVRAALSQIKDLGPTSFESWDLANVPRIRAANRRRRRTRGPA
jgi:uncharacterized protein